MEEERARQDVGEEPQAAIAMSNGEPSAAAAEGSSRPAVEDDVAMRTSATQSRSPSYSPSLASSRHSRSRSNSRERARSRSRTVSRSPERSPDDGRRRRTSGRSRDGWSASPVPRDNARRDSYSESHVASRHRRDRLEDENDRTATSIEIRGLPKLVFAKHLEHIFGVYGRVVDIVVPTFARSGENRGRAHVVFSSIREAVDAAEHMHGGQIDGVIIEVVQRHVPRARAPSYRDRRDGRMPPHNDGRRGGRGYDDRYGGPTPRYNQRDYDDRARGPPRGAPYPGRNDYGDRRPPPPERHDRDYSGDAHMHPSRRRLNSDRSHDDMDRHTRDRSMSWSSHTRSPENNR